MNLDRGLPPLRGDHHHPGSELFLRDQAAAARQAPGHVRPVRPGPPHRRHRRRRPPRPRQAGGPGRDPQGRGRPRRPRSLRRRRSGAGRPGRRRPPLPRPAVGPRRADRRLRDGRARRRATPPSTTWSATAAGWPGSVGRPQPRGLRHRRPRRPEPLADALGVALQITNILRDIVEDRDQMGRVYLPGRGPGALRRGRRTSAGRPTPSSP